MRSLAIDRSLEGIAGKPAGINTTPNSMIPTVMSANTPRTLYAVGKFTASANGTAIAGLDLAELTSNGAIGLVVRAGATSITCRGQTSTSNSVSLDRSGLLANKLYASMITWTGYSFISRVWGFEKQQDTTSANLSAPMVANPNLRLVSGSNGDKTTGVISIVYATSHNENTYNSILSYLSMRYANYIY